MYVRCCTGGSAVNCRNCAAAMVPVGGAAYFRCGHCGTFEFPTRNDDGIADGGRPAELDCPVCQVQLASGSIEGYAVAHCGTCRGFLTTNVDFTEILPRRRIQFADQPMVPRSFDPKELQRRLSCPRCRKTMDTHPYGGGGNAVVDTCHRCHFIWLDSGELEILARYRPANRRLGEPILLVPKYDGPPREPESPLRWAWDDPDA